MRFLLCMALIASAPAYAQHDHSHDDHHQHGAGDGTSMAAGATLVAATFDTRLYTGNYQGVVPSARWSNARFAVMASGALYRIELNGASYTGLGDLGVHVQALLARADAFDVGISAGVTFPIGDDQHGLGMGHVMAMPAVFAAWTAERFRLAATVGYSRGFGDDTHDHGAWPIVSPMLMAEISWSAGADVRVTRSITAGARASGGTPAGEEGPARAIAAARVAWHAGRLDTSFELQAGLAGDPFIVRGVLATMLSF